MSTILCGIILTACILTVLLYFKCKHLGLDTEIDQEPNSSSTHNSLSITTAFVERLNLLLNTRNKLFSSVFIYFPNGQQSNASFSRVDDDETELLSVRVDGAKRRASDGNEGRNGGAVSLEQTLGERRTGETSGTVRQRRPRPPNVNLPYLSNYIFIILFKDIFTFL